MGSLEGTLRIQIGALLVVGAGLWPQACKNFCLLLSLQLCAKKKGGLVLDLGYLGFIPLVPIGKSLRARLTKSGGSKAPWTFLLLCVTAKSPLHLDCASLQVSGATLY